MARNENGARPTQARFRTARAEVASASGISLFTERHYTAAELAEHWNLSLDTIRRLFQDEPGVLALGDNDGKSGKRRYTTLRIPESVAARVHRRLSKV
jgi:hypothetical protein